jgi:hypothetical protein
LVGKRPILWRNNYGQQKPLFYYPVVAKLKQ